MLVDLFLLYRKFKVVRDFVIVLVSVVIVFVDVQVVFVYDSRANEPMTDNESKINLEFIDNLSKDQNYIAFLPLI